MVKHGASKQEMWAAWGSWRFSVPPQALVTPKGSAGFSVL